jgi:tight adherence protein B
LNLRFLDFGFVSDFEIRISDLAKELAVIDQTLPIVVAIACFSSVTFFVLRRLLGRRLAVNGPDVAAPTTPKPNLAQRLDHTFEAMVHGTGMPLSVGQTLGLFAVVALATSTLLFFWRDELWAAALGLALGLALPLIILVIFRGRRRRQIQNLLPDAFFFMARSLRAGVSLEQTLTRAGEQMEEPLAGEFRRCASQVQLGLHPQAALRNAAARIGLLDFNVFVSTVALYYESGGNLALLLDRLAATARDRIQFLGYFRAATALGRAAAVFLGSAVPVIVAAYAIWEPEHTHELFRTAAGWQLLGIAAVLEVVGIIWFLYLLRVDY